MTTLIATTTGLFEVRTYGRGVGLVITGFGGTYTLTHERSGKALVGDCADLDALRGLLATLTWLGADWSDAATGWHHDLFLAWGVCAPLVDLLQPGRMAWDFAVAIQRLGGAR